MVAPLDAIDWEKLLAEKDKDKSQAVLKASPATVTYLSGSILRNTTLLGALWNLGTAPSRSLKTISSALWGRIAEWKSDRRMRSLVTNGQMLKQQEAMYAAALRMQSPKLQSSSAVKAGSCSNQIQPKVLESRLKHVSAQLDAQICYPPVELYKEFLDLLYIVCSGKYAAKLVSRIWDLLLLELRRGNAVHFVTAMESDPDVRDVHLLLRFLAEGKLSGWTVVPPGFSPGSRPAAKSVVRRTTFSSDSYKTVLRITDGFYDLLLGLLGKCPKVVHEAFDSEHLHLLWIQYMVAYTGDSDHIEISHVIEQLTYHYHKYPKFLDISLPKPIQCLVLFLSSMSDPSELNHAVQHIVTSISAFRPSHTAWLDMASVFDEQPGLRAGELAHPALPFLCFATHLMQHSETAAEMMMASDFLDTLHDLWVSGFHPPEKCETGRWVLQDKRGPAMRILSCLAFSAMASHEGLRPWLAKRLVATDGMCSWFWDVATHALYQRLCHTGPHWSDICAYVQPLALSIMEKYSKFPQDHGLKNRLVNPESLIWIFQTSHDQVVDEKLRSFALDVLIHIAMEPSMQWKEALHVLDSCNEDTVDILYCALSNFITHYLDSVRINRGGDKDTPASVAKSLRPLHDMTISRNLFMSNPLDRFVMFMSNAARKNSHVSIALGRSNVIGLIDKLLAGRFDLSAMDEPSFEWRVRTCYDVCLKMMDTDAEHLKKGELPVTRWDEQI